MHGVSCPHPARILLTKTQRASCAYTSTIILALRRVLLPDPPSHLGALPPARLRNGCRFSFARHPSSPTALSPSKASRSKAATHQSTAGTQTQTIIAPRPQFNTARTPWSATPSAPLAAYPFRLMPSWFRMLYLGLCRDRRRRPHGWAERAGRSVWNGHWNSKPE